MIESHRSILVAATLAVAMLCGGAQTSAVTPGVDAAGGRTTVPSAAVITAADISSAVKRLSPKFTDDEPLRVVEAGANRLGVFVVGRPKKTGPPQTESGGAVRVTEGLQLEQVSAVLHVLGGAGTFVAGGTLVNPQRMRPNDPDAEVIGAGSRASAILGGRSRRISVGDTVIVPAGMPHGFSEIESPITYLVIRVDTGGSLPLK